MFKIGDLEAACTSVLAPPQFTTPQKRRDAEEFLIDFREKASKNKNDVIIFNFWNALHWRQMEFYLRKNN